MIVTSEARLMGQAANENAAQLLGVSPEVCLQRYLVRGYPVLTARHMNAYLFYSPARY
jgi:hypothetical protein